jgi:recombination protein RecA
MSKKANLVKEELKKKGFNIKLASEIKEGEKIKTKLFPFDFVLDGGIYQGEGGHRIELSGKENSGKTTFTLLVMKRFQDLNKSIMYINAENSYDKKWAETLGVNNDKVYIAQPESLEQAGDMLYEFIGKYDLIVIDSIPSLITLEELDGTMEENKYMASQAKVMSPLTRKVYSATGDKFTTIIFINQIREKVGCMYGNPENTPGGRALKHLYHTRVEFRIGQPIEESIDGEETDKKEEKKKKDKVRIGHEINIKCIKNKRGKAYRNAVVDFYYNGTFDNKKALLYNAIKFGLITGGGAWYQYEGNKFNGKKEILEKLTDKDWDKIEKEIWSLIK